MRNSLHCTTNQSTVTASMEREHSLQLDGIQILSKFDLTGGTVKLLGREGLHPPCAEQYLHTSSTTSSTATALLGRAICKPNEKPWYRCKLFSVRENVGAKLRVCTV